MLIPAMREVGWEVEVLYPDQSYQAAYSFDPESPRFYPEVPEHPVGPWMEEIFKVVGSRSIGIRAGVPLARQGLELLRSRKFDVVYFSTTQHLLTCAGPWWRRKTGVPYVADVHDPVFIPQPKYRTSPGGLKAKLARQIGKWIEKRALAQADGIVSVSRGYVDDLLARNPDSKWASGIGDCGLRIEGVNKLERVLVQPFPSDERGLEMVKAERRETGKKRIVYVGAGGAIMEKGWREFLAQLKKEPLAGEVVIEIYGTDPFWKTGDRVYLQKISEEMGLRGLVVEEPKRVAYERSLALVKGADGLLVLGVDDPNYQPSKLHTYLATGLPVMVLARAGSDLPRQIEGVEGVNILKFEAERRPSFAANSCGGVATEGSQGGIGEYLQSVKEGKRWPGRRRLTVKEAAITHAQLFNALTRAVSR
jgi:hypothetical protein